VMAGPLGFAKSSIAKVGSAAKGAKTSGSFVAKQFQRMSADQKTTKTPGKRSTPNSMPPKWFKDVPFPKEPPQSMKAKLERENHQKNQIKPNGEKN
jgi:hypothetical protein